MGLLQAFSTIKIISYRAPAGYTYNKRRLHWKGTCLYLPGIQPQYWIAVVSMDSAFSRVSGHPSKKLSQIVSRSILGTLEMPIS